MQIDKKKFFDGYRRVYGALQQDTVDTLDAILDVFIANTPSIKPLEKYAYMLATVRYEVGPNMTPIVENMNYSAKRITQVWPSRFKTIAAAEPYAHNPAKLGNNVYANRLGNGDAASGDGYKYRGRGIGAQFTGRVNYEKFSKLFNIDLVNNPDLAMDNKIGAEILYLGSTKGLFTGVSLGNYINENETDFVNARRVVNNDVKRSGKKIAEDAVKFLNILKRSV
jgi:putative chitinase